MDMSSKDVDELKGDEVVISGISGIFPKCNSTSEFMRNLYSKVDMVSSNNPRWSSSHPEMPKHLGMVDDMGTFDAQFFKVHSNLAYVMEPMARKLFEHSYGAIYDAGFSPKELQGRKIGIFIACGPNEYEKFIMYDHLYYEGFSIPGSYKAMFANRISYWIDSKSPSYSLEAGSSFMACLDLAFRSINSGNIEAAIIGSSNFCTLPGLSLNLSKAGVLCLDGKTKCFDQSGDGYVRADSVNVFFLQKAKDARRIYSEVYHTKCFYHTTTDKYVPERETKFIEQFLEGFYSEIYMNPSDVEYIEGSASGIAEYDGNELKAVGKVFSKESPIKIGCVKSNMGNAETASEGCAIAKICLAYHKGEIPANLHYNQPQNHIPSVRDRKVQVLTENTPFKRGFIACNGFTELGTNSHVLLKGHYKSKDLTQYKTAIPYLVFASGRLEYCVSKIFDKLKSQPVDPELIGLLHSIHSNNISGHIQRGYLILDDDNSQTICLRQSNTHFPGEKPQLWFIYSGMGSQWPGMGAAFMCFPAFSAAINKCQNVLLPKGVDVIKIISDPDKTIFENSLNSFVGITAMQIGLTDLLKDIGLVPDYFIGHSLGDLVCAYCDGCLTAEETILISYIRGKIAIEMKSIRGSMVAVGLGYKDVLPLCPPEIDIACHNSPDSATLSGPADIMAKFVVQLTSRGIFAKEVPCGNIAYHSRYILSAKSTMISALKNIIKEVKLRSPKWISSCMPQSMWKDPIAQYNSCEYHCFNLMNPVLFEESASLIPKNSVLVEVAPHCLFQFILRKSHKQCIYLPLTRRIENLKEKETLAIFLGGIGRLYELGFNTKVERLYPKIQYPVSTETPLLSHFVEFNHSDDWPKPMYEIKETVTAMARDQIISMYDDDYKYFEGYIRNGITIIPEAAFLVFVWETLAMYKNKKYNEMSVIFDEVQFHNVVIIKEVDMQTLRIMIMKSSGAFEISYKNMQIVSGTITELTNTKFDCNIVTGTSDEGINLNKTDVHKLMNFKGYSYSDDFQNIYKLNMQRGEANIKWTGDWITFIDSLLHINMLLENYDGVTTTEYIMKLSINVDKQKSGNVVSVDGEPCFDAEFSKLQRISRCGGVEVKNMLMNSCPDIEEEPNIIQAQIFIPHILVGHINFETALHINLQIIKDNFMKDKIQITELSLYPASSISETVRLVADVLQENYFDISSYNISSIYSDILNVIGNSDVIIAHDLLGDKNKTNDLHRLLSDDTFILAVEQETSEIYPLSYNLFTIITTISAREQTLILLKKACIEKKDNVVYINVCYDDKFSWIPNVVQELKSDKKVVLVSQNQPLCGLFGFVKKLKEEFGNRIGLVIIDDDKAPKFDVEKSVFRRQLEKNLTFNILHKGRWGSYYYIPREKHLSFQDICLIRTAPGNNCLKWVENPTTSVKETIKVSYASLSYKDAERAIGDFNESDDNVFGMDFSGINARGERVMGIVSQGAVSSSVEADPDLLWPVPGHWDLEDAATVPLPYLHAFYCLVLKGKLKRGSNVLITGGAGALGQAIISICQDFNCTVFTTVSDTNKKLFLLRLFPNLNENTIYCHSRNELSYEMVSENYQSCDLVINFSSGAIREAAYKCKTSMGVFIDLSNLKKDNNWDFLNMYIISNFTYMNINVSSLFKYNNTKEKKILHQLVSEGITKGFVKPLTRVVYSTEEVSRAFRLLATRRHIGRVLINMNDAPSQVIPRIMISPEVTYIVVCGENDLGVELIERLIKRGVRKLVIQRNNLDGYFNMKLMKWQKLGVAIKLVCLNLQSKEGCEKLLKEGSYLNKNIEGVIIVDRSDKLSEDKMNQENMRNKFNDLALVVANLDLVTRTICDKLRYFVVLTNNSANIQDQYAMSASEKICQARNLVGLPSLFFCAKMINKAHQTYNSKSNIKTCLNALETCMKLKYNNIHSFNMRRRVKNVSEEIEKILGIPDLADVPDNLTLDDLHVSRISVEEIKTIMKETYQVCRSNEYIRDLTIADIKELKFRPNDVQQTNYHTGFKTFFSHVENYESKGEPITSLSTRLGRAVEAEDIDSTGNYLMVLPGFEGNHKPFIKMCKNLKIQAVSLLLEPDMPNSSIEDMAQYLLKFIKKRFVLKSKFYLLGYSFGVNIALQLSKLLEKEGHVGVIFCLDSSPDALRVQLDAYIGKLSTPQLQNAVIQHMYGLMTNQESTELGNDLELIEDWSEKIRFTITRLKSKISYLHEYIKFIIEAAYRKIVLAQEYDPDFKLESQLVLMKGIPHPEADRLADDYSLSKYTKQPVKVYDIHSDHVSAPQDRTVANYINRNLDSKLLDEFKAKNLCDRYVHTKVCY